MDTPYPKIISLKNSDYTLSDSAEDIRGRKVLDKDSNEIGKVNDLFLDEREMKVRFIEVSSGGLLGIGDTTYLLPLDAITAIEDEYVSVDQVGEKIAAAPRYDPDLIDEKYQQSMYSYYGYSPYWGMGYIYPPFPYYGPRRSGRRPRRVA